MVANELVAASTTNPVFQQIRPSILRASLAVARRQIRIHLRYPGWFLVQLVWPVMIPMNYVFAARALAGQDGSGLATFAKFAGTSEYVGYLVIGTTFWMWFNWMLWGLGTAFRTEQLRGTLESNWLAPLPKVYMALGSFLGEAALGLIVVVMSTVSATLVYRINLAGNLGLFALVVLCSTVSVYGFGLIFASLVLAAKESNSFVFLARGLMTILCGVSYPVSVLPASMQAVSEYIPMTHSIRAVREVVAGGSLQSITREIVFLLVSGAALLALGLLTFEIVQRRMLNAGSLGRY